MDYIRQLTGSARLKANSSRGESPISDIVESAEEAQIIIDTAIQAVLHAAEVARRDDIDDTEVNTMDTKDTAPSHVGNATQVDAQQVRFEEGQQVRLEEGQTRACDAVEPSMTEEQAAQALRALYDTAEQHDAPVETQPNPVPQIRFAHQATPTGNVRPAEPMDESMPLFNQHEPGFTQPEPVDAKPNRLEAPEENTIALNIRDANGYSTTFRCKPSTKLSKVFKVFAKRYHTELSKIRFISSDGTLLPKNSPTLTVESEGFEDGDEIDVMLEQIGGCHVERI